MDYMGRMAFAFSNISSVVYPRNLESIKKETFILSPYLTSVTIPETVVNIEENAFWGCERLSEVKILGSSLRSIGPAAFKKCSKLTSINIPNSVTEICDSAFQYCETLPSITLPPSLTHLGSAFKRCYKLRSVILSPNLTEIRDETFCSCALDTIIIPNSVKRIGKSAFAYCSKLSSIIFADGLESIDGLAFANNSSLTSVILPNSLKTIGYRAFSNDEDSHRILKTVVIPAGVEEIGSGAFSHINRWHHSSMVDDLKDIYCHVVTPIDSYVFNNQSEKTLHVPAQSVGLYRNHVYWNQFKEIVPLTNEETGISPTTMRESDDGIHYSLSGSRISPESKGIHLVRYHDGTVRKVIRK